MPPIRTRTCLILAGWVLLIVASFIVLEDSAFAQSSAPGVFYSYENVQLGDTAQWVLIPKPLRTRMAGDLETNVRAAYKALSLSKRPTYGRSKIEIDPGALKKGRVTIKIDSDKVTYQSIIEAEVLATFATLGIKEVEFKGGHEHTLRTDQVAFTTFTITLPIWQALPPAKIYAAKVKLPDGSLVNIESFQKKLKSKDSAILKHIFAELKSGAPVSQVALLKSFSTLKLSGWEAEAVKLLGKGAPEVQIAAINALGTSKDKKSLAALIKVVDKGKNPTLQAAAAKALSSNKDKKYSAYGVYYTLRGEDAEAAVKAIDTLVAGKVTEAKGELLKTIQHKKARVAIRAAKGLRELGGFSELAKSLKDTKLPKSTLEAIASELSLASDSKAAMTGLTFLASQGQPSNALAAITKLASYKEPAPAIAKALANPDSNVRRAAALALVPLKDDHVTKAMSKAITAHPEDTVIIEGAMVQLLAAAEPLGDLKDRLKSGDPRMKRAAYQALASRAKKEKVFKRVREKFVDGLKDKNPLSRGGAILGLSLNGAEADLVLLTPLAKDSNKQIRADVAQALGNYPAGKASTELKSLIKDKEATVIIAAIAALGKRKEKKVLKDLSRMQKSKDASIRRALLPAIADLVEPSTLPDVLSALSKGLIDSDKSVRLVAIKTMGRFPHDTAIEAIALLVGDADKEIQFAAFQALGTSQAPRAVNLIAEGFEDDSPKTRKAALSAMRRHGSIKGLSKIKALLKKESDASVKALAEDVAASIKGN